MAGRGMTIRKDTIPPPRARHCDINGSYFFLISSSCPSSNLGHDSAPGVEERPSETVYKQPSQVGACHRTPPHHHCLLTLGFSAAPTPAERRKRSSIRSAVMLFSGMPAASWLSPLRCIALPHLSACCAGLLVLLCLSRGAVEPKPAQSAMLGHCKLLVIVRVQRLSRCASSSPSLPIPERSDQKKANNLV